MQWEKRTHNISMMIPMSMKKSKNSKCTQIRTKHPSSFKFKVIEESILLSTNMKRQE